MALDPSFCTIPNNGTPARLGVLETSYQAPTTTSLILTAGASGSLLYEVTVEAEAATLTGPTVAGLVYLWLSYDNGSTFSLYDTVTIPAVTPSATVAPARAQKLYPDGVILKANARLYASQSIAGNNSILKVSAFALDA